MTKINHSGTREIITSTVRAAGYAESAALSMKLGTGSAAVTGELVANGWAAFGAAGLCLTPEGFKLGLAMLS